VAGARKGRSLFEVMNKPPKVERPGRRRWVAPFRRDSGKAGGSAPVVAEALSEEEAQAELAQERAEAEARAKQARETPPRKRLSIGWPWKREEKKDDAAPEEAKAHFGEPVVEADREAGRRGAAALAVDSGAAGGFAPVGAAGESASMGAHGETASMGAHGETASMVPVQVRQGRVNISLTTPTALVACAVIVAALLGAYSLGRRTGDSPARRPPVVAAKAAPDGSAAPVTDVTRGGEAPGAGAASDLPTDDPELARLLTPPVEKGIAEVSPNRPASVSAGQGVAVDPNGDLNYLQIESFRITRYRTGEQLAGDLADVRRFLAGRGVATFARKHGNGYALYAAQGYRPGGEHEAARERFRRRIEALGRAYRESGGLYEFKGCLFVSSEKAAAGDPV